MLIPISHERDLLLRWPIVTLVVIAACVAVHLWAWPPEDETPLAQEALVYYLERPYLEPPEELLAGLPSALFERHQLVMERTPDGRPRASQRRREQRELDALVEAWREVRDRQKIRVWGLVPADYQPEHLVTHQFFHVGWLHLLSNMLILYLAAPPVEDLWGRPLFAVFYLAAGAAAGLAFIAKYPLTMVPLVGASGAIAGVMGVFLVRFWNIRIKFFYFIWLIRVFTGTFRAPAWLMLPLWFGNEIFSAYVADRTTLQTAEGAGGGVAYLAHIGGFVFGVMAAVLVRMVGLEDRMKGRIHGKIGLEEHPVLEAAAEARRVGAPEEAMNLLAAELRAKPSDREVLGALWDAAVDARRAAEVAPRLQHLIELELRDGDEDFAIQHWDELLTHAPEARVAPRVAAAVAERMVAMREEVGARQAIERGMAGSAVLPPMTALRMARAAGGFDATLAAAVARRALGQRDLEPELRAELEALAAAEPAADEARSTSGSTPEPPPSGVGTRPSEAPNAQEPEGPAPVQPRLRPGITELRRIAAVPRALGDDALSLTTGDGKAVLLRLEKILGVAVAEIRPGDEPPFFLVDLLLDAPRSGVPTHRLVRLDTRGFDPHVLAEGEDTVPRALVSLVGRLLAATGADLFPKELDPFSAQPFSSFPSVEFYERELTRQLEGAEEA